VGREKASVSNKPIPDMSPRDRRATLRAAFYIVSAMGIMFSFWTCSWPPRDNGALVGGVVLLWIALNVATVLVAGGSTLFGLFPKVEEPSEGEKSSQS